jgi:2-succinyl-5-enolpyruvyl-6-hydroxy-3-cyclohexene-1-carboxylate synthase
MSPPRDTYLGLRAFVDELARCGVRHACTSPGSRSTPLVLSLAREPRLRATSHLDERCGAFFALGSAKATGIPSVLACTSGTAVVNYAPAVVEAYEARVPLLVLTADRPPELRDVGAGQTIDQVKVFGRAAKWYIEIDDAPATPARMRWLRQLACRAVWTAVGDRPGPVHLNFALREPLVLDEPLDAGEPGGGGRPDGRPWTDRAAARALMPAGLEALQERLEAARQPLFVAGRMERVPPAGPRVVELAERLCVPLLADPLSQARSGAAIAHYDAFLRDADWAAAHTPDLVVRFGDLPTSKPLRTWLSTLEDVEQIAVDAEAGWQDPAAVVSLVVQADAASLCSLLSRRPVAPAPASWRGAWRAADEAARDAIAATLGAEGLCEPAVAAALGRELPPDAIVVVAASMPIRDVESFFATRPDPPRVLSNRGANGIDGTASTAFGIAAAVDGPVVLLTGDVTLLHDLGGLLAARRLGLQLTIVCINNDGGGIFHFLPVANATDAFEEHVATPHAIDLEAVANVFGLAHERATTVSGLCDALARALAGAGSTLIEVPGDRGANVAVHRRVWPAVAEALGALA